MQSWRPAAWMRRLMKRICVAGSGFFAAGLVMMGIVGPLKADPITTASPQLAGLHVNQPDLPLTLSAGAVRGDLTVTSLNAIYSDGASAFAQLTLSSQTAGKKGDAAEVMLRAEGAEIVSIIGA